MAFEVQLFSVNCLNRIIHQSGAELIYSFEIVLKPLKNVSQNETALKQFISQVLFDMFVAVALFGRLRGPAA